MTKLLNKVSVKLGIVFVCGIMGGCVLYYNIALPILERGIFAIPVILFPLYILHIGFKISWRLFDKGE